jgi:hypothetical protein
MAVAMKIVGRLPRALFALAIGTVAAVVVLEVLLRSFDGLMPESALLRLHWRELLEDGDLRSMADPELGFRFRPGVRDEYALRDLTFAYETDEHGFRNATSWPEEAEIVVVGDSLAFGFGVEDADSWTRVVDEGLAEARVVNLALPGYGPEQYARAYESYGAELSPKLLIIGLFPTNDVRDQGKFEEWLALGAPGNYDVWRFEGGSQPDLLRRTYVYIWLKEAVKRGRQQYSNQRLELDDGPMNLTPSIIMDPVRSGWPDEPRFASVVGSLERVQEIARTAGTRTLVLLFPCKEEVYLPSLGIETPEPVKPFAAVCRERGWEHLDLTPIYAERARLGERLFFEIDGHPNERGNRVAAEAVRNWIREEMPQLR